VVSENSRTFVFPLWHPYLFTHDPPQQANYITNQKTMAAPSQTVSELKQAKKTVVALAAPSGWLGGHLASGFVANPNYQTRLLTQELVDKDGRAKFETVKAQGATVMQVDYQNVQTLADALKGVDILVSAVGFTGLLEPQLKLIDAAVQAKVRRFVPSEFGPDARKSGPIEPVFSVKEKVLDKIKSSGLEWTVIYNGCFLDTLAQPVLNIVDLEHKTINMMGSESTSVSWLSLDDVAQLVPLVLLHPASKNTYATLHGETKTFGEIANELDKLTGKKVTRVVVPAENLQKEIDANPDKWATLAQFFQPGPGERARDNRRRNLVQSRSSRRIPSQTHCAIALD